MNSLVRFLNNESGVAAIEYGLLAVFIAAVIVVAVTAAGTSLNASYTATSNALK
jgi:pilus assembly protein Flp/PilA